MTEPIFRLVDHDDPALAVAHARAAATIEKFRSLVESNHHAETLAKLRFRDPDVSDKSGVDQFLYLWLSMVVFHQEERLFSGTFFEVPSSFRNWHKVGDRLAFEAEDVFDWMVIGNGRMRGGYTIRLTRSRLRNDAERSSYDSYLGITSLEPIDK